MDYTQALFMKHALAAGGIAEAVELRAACRRRQTQAIQDRIQRVFPEDVWVPRLAIRFTEDLVGGIAMSRARTVLCKNTHQHRARIQDPDARLGFRAHQLLTPEAFFEC